MKLPQLLFAVIVIVSFVPKSFADTSCATDCDKVPIPVASSSVDFNGAIATQDFNQATVPTLGQLLGSWLQTGVVISGDQYSAESDSYDPKGLGKTLKFWNSTDVDFTGNAIGLAGGFDLGSEEAVHLTQDGASFVEAALQGKTCKIIASSPAKLLCESWKRSYYAPADSSNTITGYEGYVRTN